MICDEKVADWIGATVGSNNVAELCAVIEAETYIKLHIPHDAKVTIHCDSDYAVKNTRKRIKAQRNRELVRVAIQAYESIARTHDIAIAWLKGHAGHNGDEKS